MIGSCVAALIRDRKASVAVTTAVLIPVLLVFSGAAVDYSRSIAAKRNLQSIADSAALEGVGVFRTAAGTRASAESVARSQAAGAYVTVSNYQVDVSSTTTDVQVDLSGDVATSVMKIITRSPVHITVHAKARLVGVSVPTCMIALDPAASDTFSQAKASLSAPGCSVYSDSVSPQGMTLDNQAKLTADLICSSGGAIAKGGAIYSVKPLTDCPGRADPLASRASPSVGACTATNLKVQASTVLVPGVYCGGLEVQNKASVMLQPGTYVIKDGPLKANGSATMTGSGVTFYLTGNNATLDIAGQSSLDLTAPAFGPLAGILIFEDRTVKTGQTHKLNSRDAPNLLGTVYLSQGTLEVGAPGGYATTAAGMAQSSAWTIVVVRKLSVNDRINLVLNTNYSATVVPPPDGFSSTSSPHLVQ